MKFKLSWFTCSIILFLTLTSFTQAAQQMILISGGNDPSKNHYSQYLQTQALSEFFKKKISGANFQVLFGAGNRPDRTSDIADVHRLIKHASEEGLSTQMVAGVISDNQAATKSNILASLYQLAATPTQDPLFMVVTDHGMPNTVNGVRDATFTNNCINTWAFSTGPNHQGFAISGDNCLSKNDVLQTLNAAPVPTRREVFVMTQCFSGGFHQLSVSEKEGYPTALTNRCGFTAVPPDSPASGCTAEADGPAWQGYERFFAEKLIGKDLVSGKSIGPGKKTFLGAHYAATLEDFTIDVPMSTSDYYLSMWAGKLLSPQFQSRALPKIEEAKKQYTAVASLQAAPELGQKFKEKLDFIKAMAKKAGTVFPEIATVLNHGSLNELGALHQTLALKIQLLSQGMGADQAVAKNALIAVNTAWTNAILARDSSVGLSLNELGFETGWSIPKMKQFGLDNFTTVTLATLSMSTLSKPEEAKWVAAFFDHRTERMMLWALASKKPDLVALATSYHQVGARLAKMSKQGEILQKQAGMVRRIWTYRSGIGAWAALATLNDTIALKELDGLLACEATPLPN